MAKRKTVRKSKTTIQSSNHMLSADVNLLSTFQTPLKTNTSAALKAASFAGASDSSANKYEPVDLNFVRAAFDGNKLVNIVFGVKEKITGTAVSNDVVYFADNERQYTMDNSTSLNGKYNKNCLISTDAVATKKQLIHNLYRSDDCFFKSAIYKASKSNRSDSTYDYQDITTHRLSTDTQLVNVVQTDGIFYALQPMSNYGRYHISCDIYSWLSVNNSVTVPPDTYISTEIYNLPEISAALKDNDQDRLQKNAILTSLSNINYNMIYEIPGRQYNDFESGNIAANSFKCKNAFNSLYNMNHTSDAILSNARNYVGVGNCNKQVYLTYYDNIEYSSNTASPEKTQQTHSLSYQHVELLGSMNRYTNLNGHKTNLYSIATYTDIFNCINDTNEDSLKIKQNLKQELQHAIKDIVSKLAPVNTQLLSAYVNELK